MWVFIISTSFILLVFFFSSVCLVFFVLFLCLIALFDWISLFSLYCILIFLLLLHLGSNNTLLLIIYFLFWLSKSYISCHIIVAPVLLQIIVVPYNCTYYTATLPDLSPLHFNPDHYYCCGQLYSLSHYAYFLSFTLTISHHLTLHKCSIFWIQLRTLLPSNKSYLSPFIKSGSLGEISLLTLSLSKESPSLLSLLVH